MLKLDGRLQAVLDEVQNVNTLADIGCDHGKTIVKAILTGKANYGIAVDISASSLEKAKILAEKYNVSDKIQFYKGDGLLPLKEKIDCAIIAGMGGYEIAKILIHKELAEKYILVPHQDAYILRQFLRDNDFFIVKDYVIKEHKYYPIIVATHGKNNYTDKEIFLGKNIPESNVYEEWLKSRLQHIGEIIKKTGSQNALTSELNSEWEVLKEWQN